MLSYFFAFANRFISKEKDLSLGWGAQLVEPHPDMPGHIQVPTNGCVKKWNNKLTSLVLWLCLSNK